MRHFSEFLGTLFITVLIIVVCIYSLDSKYYDSCTDAGNSYLHCFRDRVLKP